MKNYKIALMFFLILSLGFFYDLYPTSLDISRSGDQYTIKCYFDDIYSFAEPFSCDKTFYVSILVNNSEIYKEPVSSFVDETEWFISCALDKYYIETNYKPPKPGIYNITCYVDSYDQIPETNENNNKISKIIEYYLPDLTITNITVPSNIEPGQTVSVNIYVKNQGLYRITKSFNVSLYANGKLTGKATINGLNVGETKQVNIQWTPTDIGTYTLKAIVDEENVIQEINETNNEKSITKYVSSSCECSSCSECNTKLKDPHCKVVTLINNISTTSNCIIIQNLENKTFDCNWNKIVGSESYPTIPADQDNGNYGIEITNSKNITIQNCRIYNFNDGIHVSYSNHINVWGNIITNTSDDGLQASYSNVVIFLSNTISNVSNDGISLGETNSSTISINSISNCLSSGIDISHGNNNTIKENKIYNTNDGINLWHTSSDNKIVSNKIYNVKYAIISSDGTIGPNNLVYNNLFNVSIDYTKNINSINYWNTTLNEDFNIIGRYIIGGNYWGKTNGSGFSDTCLDLDRNGICDFPYKINSNNIDYLPLAGLNAITSTPCGKCICVNINRINRTLIYSVVNYCPVNYTLKVQLYNDYVPWRQPIKEDTILLKPKETYKFNKTIPDAFVGWTDFEVIVRDAVTNKTLSESGDFITNVPPKVKVDQSYFLVLLVILLISIFLIKENKIKQS